MTALTLHSFRFLLRALACGLLLACLTGCLGDSASSSTGSSPSSQNPLLGKWLLTTSEGQYVEFRPDGTFKTRSTSGEYSVQGDQEVEMSFVLKEGEETTELLTQVDTKDGVLIFTDSQGLLHVHVLLTDRVQNWKVEEDPFYSGVLGKWECKTMSKTNGGDPVTTRSTDDIRAVKWNGINAVQVESADENGAEREVLCLPTAKEGMVLSIIKMEAGQYMYFEETIVPDRADYELLFAGGGFQFSGTSTLTDEDTIEATSKVDNGQGTVIEMSSINRRVAE